MNNDFIFFGSPIFSKIVLETLIKNNYIPKILISNPDKPIGRKKIITPPATKKFILENNLNNKIKILQPEKLNENFINELQKEKLLFGIVCAYSKIIPNTILEILPNKILGVHPSLLPKYRGPSPIQSAILNGEKESGVSIYILDDKMDHGPILIQKKCEIDNLYYEEASKKLAELAGDILVKIIPEFLNNKIKPYLQDENLATYTKKFKTEDGFIEFEQIKEAEQNGGKIAYKIYNKIKALNIEPGVWTILNNKRLKIFEANIIENKLKITKIQFDGKKIKNINKPLFEIS